MIIKRGILEILNLDFLPDGLEKKEIMVEHSVSIKFELSDYVKLEKGDFIIHDEKNFSLNKDFIPVINKSTNGFIYDLKFYDITERFKDFKLKFQLGTVDELDFKLTTSGDKFLDIVIYSLHKHGLGTFTKGQFPSEIKEIHFKNVDIFSGLNQIANEYELEWWIDGPILNLGKLEYGEPVLLRNDIELEDISFSPSSEKLITRLYAFGSSRNIPSNYRINESVGDISERRLRLPIGTEYVDLFPDLPENKVVEGVHVFEDIYPRQKNTIIDVLTKDVSGTVIYTFKSDNTFTITHDDIIAGKPLKIAFQSGLLAGKEFDLIIRDNNYFEIRYEQSGDVYLPNMTLKPQVGDEFFFFNFKADNVLPVLITQAENELLTQAQNFLDKIGSEYVYTTKNRSIHCEENGIDLDVGQVVTLQSETIGSVTSRIRGYEKKLYNKFECDYSIGSYSKYSRIDKIEKETGSKADKTEISEIGGKVESVSRDIQNMDLKFLSKISVDTSKEVITFLKGIIAAGTSEFVNLIATGKITAENIDVNNTLVTDILCVLTQATLQDVILKGQINSETFTSGFLGDGFRLNKIGERWTLEIDDLVIRKTMTIYELIVQRVIHRDGWVLHSPAGAVLTNVTDGGTYWRCEHDGAVDFITGSQVFCQNFNVGSRKQNPDGSATFNGVSVKKYWRKVTSFGAGWFNLSKTDMEEGSEMPGIGDHVAVLGHKTNSDWQNAILIASTGSSSPYLAHYAGINSYSLAGKEVVREGNLSGVVDAVFGQLSGYGLYANNVFLRGIFKLVNGTDIGHKLAEHDTTFLSTASKTEVSTAKSEAISTAASDATSKANTAQTNATNAAKGYTDGQISPLVTRITSAETAISQNADAISLRATKEEVNAIQIGGENLLVGSAARVPAFNPNITGSGTRSTIKEESGEQYYTYTPNTGINLSLYGVGFTYEAAKEYVAGIFVRHSHTANIVVMIYMNVGNPLGSKSTSVPPNVWTYITSNPFKKSTNGTGYLVIIANASVAVDIKKVKIEEGNKPTTWSVNTDNAEKRVTTVEGTLTVQAGLIAAKASQTDVTALGIRMDAAELKITPTAITQTVRTSTEYGADRTADLATASADATTKVNNLQIGGLNMLITSVADWTERSISSSSHYINNFYSATLLEAGKTYTFSWEAEWISGATNMYINIGAGSSTFERNIVGTLNSSTHAFNRRSITFTPTEYQLALGNKFSFRWYNNQQAVTFRWRRIKLEEGNKPTAWDNNVYRVKQAESSIAVEKDRITLSSQKITQQLGGTITGEDVSTINITPENISLKVAQGTMLGDRNYWYPNSLIYHRAATTAAWSYSNRTLLNIISNGTQMTVEFEIKSTAAVNMILYKSPKNTIVWDGTSYHQVINITSTTTKNKFRATFTFDETRPFLVFYKNSASSIGVTIEKIMLAVGNMTTVWKEAPEKFDSDLLATGIDIENKKIILTSDIVEFRSNTGGVTNKTKILIDGSIEAIDGKFTGTVTATSGRVGSLRISGSALTNEGFDDDAYIILRNDPHGTFVGIGGNVLPASSGLKAVGRFENKSVDGFFGSVNYSLLVEASGASRNVGIYCIGDLLLKGGALIAEKCYTDAGYTNSITLNIDKFSKYLFNPPMGSINTVYMPSGSQVLSAVGSVGLTGSNWCFDIGVSIHYSSSGGINLRGVSGGIIVNNNGDVVGHNDTYTYGGIQMKKGDHVTLRYFSTMSRWLIIDHQY